MMEEQKRQQQPLQGKIVLSGILQVLTGMHIGGSSDFASIGAVDSPFIRDPFSHAPIIPGSSLKGKIRTLLAKINCDGYVLNKVADDNEIVARLFGASGKNYAMPARLQFFDLFVTEDTKNNFNAIETDTYIGEVKFENTINRASGVANPRQIERVPAGAEFDFKLVYNIENLQDVQEDLENLAEGFELLANDYLGGHGSRGYGRVRLHDIKLRVIGKLDIDLAAYEDLFKD